MDKISALLPKVLNKRGLRREADASLVVYAANAWLHANHAPEEAIATTYARGELTIAVQNAIAGQECYALHDDLLLALQNKFPVLPIQRIRIHRSKEPMVT